MYRRLGGPQGRNARVRKISSATGIRSPDRPAHSESLYRLSYRGRTYIRNVSFKYADYRRRHFSGDSGAHFIDSIAGGGVAWGFGAPGEESQWRPPTEIMIFNKMTIFFLIFLYLIQKYKICKAPKLFVFLHLTHFVFCAPRTVLPVAAAAPLATPQPRHYFRSLLPFILKTIKFCSCRCGRPRLFVTVEDTKLRCRPT